MKFSLNQILILGKYFLFYFGFLRKQIYYLPVKYLLYQMNRSKVMRVNLLKCKFWRIKDLPAIRYQETADVRVRYLNKAAIALQGYLIVNIYISQTIFVKKKEPPPQTLTVSFEKSSRHDFNVFIF